MRLSSMLAAWLCFAAGCLDTKADKLGPMVDASTWDSGVGSVKPAVAPPPSGGRVAPPTQAGSGALQKPLRASQPVAAGAPSMPAGRAVPIMRDMLDAGPAPDAAATREPPPPSLPAPSRSGELIITELMIDPKALPDTEGEWIELYNASDSTLELRDCQLDDGADSLHMVPLAQVESGAYFTIARTAEPGFVPDLIVPLSLTNGADSVAIICDGREIDRVSYDKSAEFAVKAGASLALDPLQLDARLNEEPGAWCESAEAFDADFGTPGRANPSCHGDVEEADSSDEEIVDAGAYDAGDASTSDAGYDAGYDAEAGAPDAAVDY